MRFALKPPRIATWFVLISSLLAFTRFLVLFCESFSIVRSERQADRDLIELCSAGAAKDSDKFRDVCMKARSEQAAPLLLKAILRAIRTGFADFAECFNSPSRIAILLLFCLSGLALPVVKALSTIATTYISPGALARAQGLNFDNDDDDQQSCSVVLLDGAPSRFVSTAVSRLRALPGRTRRGSLPSLAQVEEAAFEGQEQTWTSIKLGKEQ